ncbi:lipopolysaccharide biosynthesis protein [Microbacterium sp. NPDC019599]|uniref:lipopolysaccharide biosynthesis protein n=1 Tax=Microbacterium sp. NPDC019599 TaxID=3154690 RepID=UPI003408366F
MTSVQPKRGLGKIASRGAAVTLVGQILRVTLQLAGIVLLARLLSPTDYGVTAMVLAIIGVGEILRDFGLSSAAIQAKTLSVGQRTNLFWINVGIGAVLTTIVAALAVPIADFYGDPRLLGVTLALAPTFLFNGIATQFRADLNRRFRFGQLAGVEIFAQACALGIALMLALWGWGYWALVAQQVIQAFLQVVILPFLARWLPGLPRRGEPMRSLLTFGGGLVTAQLLVYASRNVDSLVIGRMFGAQSLGYYNRAFQLMLLPLNQVNAPSTRVALPTLARLQDQPKRYAEFILFGQTILLNLVSLILAFSIAQAPAVISISLGPQWAPSVPIFQVLAIAGFFQAAAYATYWVVLSQGLMKRYLTYTIVSRPLVIGLIVVGAIWGVQGVAIAFAVGNALLWPIGSFWIVRGSIAPALRLFLGSLRTLVVYGIAAAVSFASTIAIPEEQAIVRLVVGFVTLLAALAIVALVFPPYRRDVLAMASARRYFRRTPAAAPDPTTTTQEER